MRRLVHRLLVVALLGTAAVAPTQGTLADESICALVGEMTLGQNLTVVPPGTTSSFTAAFAAGFCQNKGGITLSGTITGMCGLASGTGTTNNGHSFDLDWSGTMLVFSGNVKGAFGIAPTAGEDCTVGADRFIVSGAFAKSHVDFPTDLCVGQFRMTLSTPFFWPSPSTTALFHVELVTGTCTIKSSLTITGSLTGSCAFASGSGTSANGYSTSVLGEPLGGMFFTGGISGAVLSLDDPLTPGTCMTGGSTSFVMSGALGKP